MVEIYDRPQQHRSSPGRAGPPWFAGGLAGVWQLILVVLVTAAALWLLGT